MARHMHAPTQARQAKPGPAVLVALLTIGASLAVLILGLAGFVFFRTWI
jgi:hypothetical protein